MLYSIVKTDGTVLGVTESVRYIKIHENGCYTNANENDAIGVAFKNKPYNLAGYSEIENAETVIVSPTTLDNILSQYVSCDELAQAYTEGVNSIDE